MIVELRRSGGLLPMARSGAVVLDVSTLDVEAARVDELVRRALAVPLDPAAHTSASGAADCLRYAVRITDREAGAGTGPDERSLVFWDPIPHPALGALVDAIVELGEVRA